MERGAKERRAKKRGGEWGDFPKRRAPLSERLEQAINTLARLPRTTYGVPRVTKFQVLKHKFTSQKQNKLNKAHTDRMTERNLNQERWLECEY